ncbi:InlB B-repeat-containing protein [Pontibacter sp. CAU 1760]
MSIGGSVPGNGRNRKTPADVLLATLMHMQADDVSGSFNGMPVEGYWEIEVPIGMYNITVTVGDGSVNKDPESHSINIEGLKVITGFVPYGLAGELTRFKTATAQVYVSDGHLTINADGGTNTKINTAHIIPVTPSIFWSATTQDFVLEKGKAGSSTSFSLDISNTRYRGDVKYALSAVYDQPSAQGWLSFDSTHMSSEPNVTFNYADAMQLPGGLYSATVTAAAQGYTSGTFSVKVHVLEGGDNQPFVVSSSPAYGATNVSISTVSISANNLYVPDVEGSLGGVDNSTLTTSTVKLLKLAGTDTTEVLGTVQGTGGGDAISFSPEFELEPNSTYLFVITAGVQAHGGIPFLPYEATFTTGSKKIAPPTDLSDVGFKKIVIPSTVGKQYSTVTIGPDGKFYALRLSGVVERFTINPDGTLDNMEEIQTLVTKYGQRSAIGFTFDPSSTPTNLKVWVSHCSAVLSSAPAFDGNLSYLTGANLEQEQLVLTKLPRSAKDHLVNSIAFGPDGALYFNQGSNSSMGAYDRAWQRDESLLSAAVLRLDLAKLASFTLPLDVMTTNDQALINSAPENLVRMSDGTYNPYASNAPLTIYASGVRNAYDLLWHSNGQLYLPTNGSAAGGVTPASVAGTRRPDGSFYNGPVVPGTSSVNVQRDWLFRANPQKPVGYFGHPNPLRGEYVSFRGYLDNSKYIGNVQPDFNFRDAAYNFEFNVSPNGVIEYKSEAFGGKLKGMLLVCRFSGGSDVLVLEPGARTKDSSITIEDDSMYDIVRSYSGAGAGGIVGLSGLTNPLDIIEDVNTGNLYVIEFNWNNIPDKSSQITLLRVKDASDPGAIATVSPLKIVDNDVAGGEPGKNKTITVGNSGDEDLYLTGIAMAGADQEQFKLIGVPAASVGAPVTLAPNSAITFNVAFHPTAIGIKKAKVSLSFANSPNQEIQLNGLGTKGIGGDNEPSLQQIFDVHGYDVKVGDDDKTTKIIHSTNASQLLLGEEVDVKRFQRALNAPVAVEPLAVFGEASTGNIASFGWHLSGDTLTAKELFQVEGKDFQTVAVQPVGAVSFEPDTLSFGIYAKWSAAGSHRLYGQDTLNTFTEALPHHVRVYKLKNTDSTAVPNAYAVAIESGRDGLDYQDMVVAVRNVKPYGTILYHTLSIASEGEGTVVKSPEQSTYKHGSLVTLTATPVFGYRFAGWSGVSDTTETIKLVMDSDKEITAIFEPANHATNLITSVTSLTGRSYVLAKLATGVQHYTDRSYEVTAVPAYLQEAPFVRTPNSDKASKASEVMRLELSRDARLYVAYDPRATALPAWLSGWKQEADVLGVTDGSISSLKLYSRNFLAGTVSLGGNLASPAAGAGTGYIVIAHEAQGTVVPWYTLSVTKTGEGTVSKSPNQTTFRSGSNVTLIATPAFGYRFAGWGGAAAGTLSDTAVVLMDADKVVTALFEEIPKPVDLVKSVTSITGRSYVLAKLATGVQHYTDRSYEVTAVPAYLRGAPFVRTPNSDKASKASEVMRLELSRDARLYVAYDPRATALPAWLSGWKQEADVLGVTDGSISSLKLYSRNFLAGTVSFGGNLASPAAGAGTNYLVIAYEAPENSFETAQAAQIQELGSIPGLAVYPNPTGGEKVQVELNGFAARQSVRVTMHDAMGRHIQTKADVTDRSGVAKLELPINNLSKGVYLIRAQTDTESKLVKLLIR